ncbi:MAG: AAA family ATPase [Nitrospirae bacterium]|nr:AAA family ATPase [Nitrospirota bacterium]
MIILELACFGLRSFRQVTKLALKPGLNVIHGRTGSGKSTLFDCLQVLLFGLDAEPLRSGLTGANGSSQAAVTVRLRGGDIYRVIRDFAKDSFHIQRWDQNAKAFAPMAAEPDTLARLFQPECDGLSLDAVRALTAWSPRTSADPAEEPEVPNVPDFTHNVAASPAALTADERAAKVQRLAELRTKLAQAERLAQSADERAAAREKEAEARHRLAALDALRARREASSGRKGEMAPFLQGPKELDALLDGYIKALPALDEERAALEEEAGALAGRIAGTDANPLLKTPLFWVGAGVTGVSFLVAAFVPLRGGTRYLCLAGIGIGLSLLVASLILDFRRLGRKKSLETARAELSRKLSRLEERLKKTYAAPVALIAQTGCPDADTFKAKRRAALEWSGEQARFDQEEANLLDGGTRETLEAEWQAAKTRADALMQDAGEDVDLESLRDAIGLLTRDLDASDAAPAPSAAPSPPTATSGVPPDTHTSEIDVCLLRLSEERLQAVITRDNAVWVRRRGGAEVPIEQLSHGEALQARLSVVLGKWAARRAGLGFPLLLDEPLSGLDPQKSRRIVLDTLSRLGANRQIVVLTNGPAPESPGLVQIALAPA